MFRHPWLELLLMVVLLGGSAASMDAHPDRDASFQEIAALAAGLLLGVVAVTRWAWPARRQGQGTTWTMWGRSLPLVAWGVALLAGLALWPLGDAPDSNGPGSAESMVLWAGLFASTALVGVLTLSGAVHATMFHWRFGRSEGKTVVHRHPRGPARAVLRGLGAGLAALGWSAWGLALIYIWQDGGQDYATGMLPAGAAAMLTGAATWFLAVRSEPKEPHGYQVTEARP